MSPTVWVPSNVLVTVPRVGQTSFLKNQNPKSLAPLVVQRSAPKNRSCAPPASYLAAKPSRISSDGGTDESVLSQGHRARPGRPGLDVEVVLRAAAREDRHAEAVVQPGALDRAEIGLAAGIGVALAVGVGLDVGVDLVPVVAGDGAGDDLGHVEPPLCTTAVALPRIHARACTALSAGSLKLQPPAAADRTEAR